MPAWPASLPQSPESDSYGEAPAFPVIRADNDGPPKARRRYTAGVRVVRATFRMTLTQLEAFETFFLADIANGALSYDWRLRGDPAKPITKWQIVGKPQYAHVGGPNWTITLDLIQLPS